MLFPRAQPLCLVDRENPKLQHVPKSSQYERQTPPVIKAPSTMTICPRLCDFDVSLCHVGTVLVFMPGFVSVIEPDPLLQDHTPLPKPVINLPTINWAREKDEHCRVAPTTMIAEPMKIIFLRPSQSPSQMVAIAPTKHPRLYEAIEIPCMVDV